MAKKRFLHILAPFLECKKGIFFKTVAKRGKCKKNHFFCRNGLYSCWYKIYQEAMRFWKLFGILVHPNMHSISTVHLDVKLRTVNLDVKQRTEKVENLILSPLAIVVCNFYARTACLVTQRHCRSLYWQDSSTGMWWNPTSWWSRDYGPTPIISARDAAILSHCTRRLDRQQYVTRHAPLDCALASSREGACGY